MCKRNGNPKRSSQFICLHCMKLNQLAGIQRFGHQREKYHIKDLLCINPECRDYSATKNIEIRWCDTYEDLDKSLGTSDEILYAYMHGIPVIGSLQTERELREEEIMQLIHAWKYEQIDRIETGKNAMEKAMEHIRIYYS